MKKIFLILAFVLLMMPAFAENEKSADTGDGKLSMDFRGKSDNTVNALKADEKSRRDSKENEIAIAVHTLLTLENRTGGIGKNISAIAREFDNSGKDIADAEAKIKSKGVIKKVLFGGDKDAADKIQKEIAKNTVRIEKLKQLKAQCTDCNADIIAFLDEKIADLEKENARLQQVVTTENKYKGWFKKK